MQGMTKEKEKKNLKKEKKEGQYLIVLLWTHFVTKRTAQNNGYIQNSLLKPSLNRDWPILAKQP